MKRWVHVNKARRLLNCHFTALYRWEKKRCPALGEKIRFKRKPNMGRDGKPRTYVYGPHLKKLLAQPTFTGEYTDSSGRRWLGTRRAKELFGFSADVLKEWRRKDAKVAYLNDRTITFQLLPVQESFGESRRFRVRPVYLDSDLAQCQAGIANDPDLITQAEVTSQFGFSTMALHIWRKQGCPYLDGNKLPSFRKPVVASRVRGNSSHRMCYRCILFPRKVIEGIVTKIQSVQTAPRNPDWLSRQEVMAFGIGSTFLYQKSGLGEIRSITDWRWRNNRIMNVKLFSREDLARLKPGVFGTAKKEPIDAHVVSTEASESDRQAKETAQATVCAFAEAGRPIAHSAPIDYTAAEPPPGWSKPWYHGRRLYLDGQEVLHLNGTAIMQAAILESLQAAGWKKSARVNGLDSTKLGNAAYQLRLTFEKKNIRLTIEKDGTGCDVSWKFQENPELSYN